MPPSHRSRSEQHENTASSVGRRELLRTGATVTAVAGLAGLGGAHPDPPDSTGNVGAGTAGLQEVPGWARWIPTASNMPTDTGSGVGVFQYDVAAVLRSEEAPRISEQETISDPMKNPLTIGVAAAFIWSLGLGQLGIAEPIVGPAATEEDPDPGAVPADQGLFPLDGQVYLGSFDASAIGAAVDAGNFSETGTDGVYVHDEEDSVVTWTDEYVILGPNREFVETLVATYDGEIDRQHEESDDFAWLLANGGHGDMTVIGFSPDETYPAESGEGTADYTAFQGARGIGQSVTVDDAGATADATAAVQYPSEGDVDVDRLTSNLGTEASDTSVSREGARVLLRASYAGSVEEDTATTTTTSAGTTGTPTETTTPTETADPTTTSAGTAEPSDETTDGNDDDGEGESDGGGLPGMGVGTALAGLAGGYLLKRRRDGGGGDR